MAKKDLYCIKTDNGYGLFQEYDSYPTMFNDNMFYVVYYSQVNTLSDIEIKQAMQGEYYYLRIRFDGWTKGFPQNILLSNPNVEYSARDFWY